LTIIEDSFRDTRVITGYDRDTHSIITSFRGSSNVMNFLEDVNFFKTSYVRSGCSNCNVHEGFYAAYNSLKDKMLSAVKSLRSKYPSATVVVTGHSLGSAESLFGAVDQKQLGYDVYLYTFGCPRTGDSNFAQFVNGLITATNVRAVYRNDPVPTMAPHSFGFRHVGNEIHWYDCKNYLAYPKHTDDTPNTDLFAMDDHSSYRCLVSYSAKPEEIATCNNDTQEEAFLQ